MDPFYLVLVGYVFFIFLWLILYKASGRWTGVLNLFAVLILSTCCVAAPVLWYSVFTSPSLDAIGTVVFVVLAAAATLIGYGGIVYVAVGMAKENRLQRQFAVDRQKWYDNAKANGFVPTIKLIGSRRNLYIDEPNDRWFCMNTRYYPANTVMHKISDIRSMERAANIEQTIEAGSIYVGRGVSLGGGRINSYYTKLGIMVSLKDTEHPVEFINCIDNPDDVDHIISTFNTILERQKNHDT